MSKVVFDGSAKTITVVSGTTSLDIRIDVYKEWVDWIMLSDNSKYLPAIRYTGFDPISAGVYTGDIYFLINGWKLLVDMTETRITGVLYSDDYNTAYYTVLGVPQYPITVAAVVNTVSTGGGSGSTAEEVADAVWTHAFVKKLLTVAKYLGLK